MKRILVFMALLFVSVVGFSQTQPHALDIKGKLFLDAREFGVKADGVTNDSTAFQTACAAAITQKLPLKVSGQILLSLSAPLVINAEAGLLRIEGTGRSNTVLLASASYSGVAILFNSFFTNPVSLSNMTIKNVSSSALSVTGVMCRRYAATGWGAGINVDNVFFEGFTNAGLHIINAFNPRVNNSKFTGTGAAPTWLVDDAGLRIWGADGTTASQFYGFSNLAEIRNNLFSNLRIGLDAWNLHGDISRNTFEPVGVGASLKANRTAIAGVASGSTEKGGYKFNDVSFNSNWIEQWTHAPVVVEEILNWTTPSLATDTTGSFSIAHRNYYNPAISSSTTPFPSNTFPALTPAKVTAYGDYGSLSPAAVASSPAILDVLVNNFPRFGDFYPLTIDAKSSTFVGIPISPTHHMLSYTVFDPATGIREVAYINQNAVATQNIQSLAYGDYNVLSTDTAVIRSLTENFPGVFNRYGISVYGDRVDFGSVITLPSLSSTTPIGSSTVTLKNGMMYYDSDTHKFKGRANGSWVDLN